MKKHLSFGRSEKTPTFDATGSQQDAPGYGLPILLFMSSTSLTGKQVRT
jgi:hypothetical protein